ncbi:hypothetical protein V8F33_008024 [Rhypophila sp. PSN 637]
MVKSQKLSSPSYFISSSRTVELLWHSWLTSHVLTTMVRSPPPLAIQPSLASAATIIEEAAKESDLPLRNYTSPPPSTRRTQTVSPDGGNLPPTPPHDSSDIFSETGRICTTPVPSSTVAEFGDRVFFPNHSAVSLVEHINRTYTTSSRARSRSEASHVYSSTRSRSQSRSRSNTPTPRAGSNTPRSARSNSASTHRQLSSRERTIPTSEKVNRFLHSISKREAQDSPKSQTEQLLSENRSLHQRISALQRTETDLLDQNQRLGHQLESVKKQFDGKVRLWKDEVQEGKKKLLERIKELEAQLVEKDERLRGLGEVEELRPGLVMTDEEIKGWFATRSETWRGWTEQYGHRDPDRLRKGLHPLHMKELCEGAKGFVCLEDGEGLPNELLNAVGNGKGWPAHLLLYAMLSHFVVDEVLKSPFWVFEAFSGSTLELESPIVSKDNSISPVGFRMDLAMWNNIAALGSDRLPKPIAARRGVPSMQPAESIRQRLAIQSLSLDTANLTSIPKPSLPGRQDMENLHDTVQSTNREADNWRKQLMRTLSEGGLVLDAKNAKNPDSRLLVEARENYAKKLRERFLGGPARYLLQDQDAIGIEKLERQLLHEIDLALRFSCRIWSQYGQVRLLTLPEFATTRFETGSPTTTLCEIQGPFSEGPVPVSRADDNTCLGKDPPPACHDGNAVIMVVQPAIEGIKTNKGGKNKDGKPAASVIWAKAQVLVRTPTTTSLTSAPTTTINGTTTSVVVKEAGRTVLVPILAPVSMQAPSQIRPQMVSSPPVPPKNLAKLVSPDSPSERRFKVALLEVKT